MVFSSIMSNPVLSQIFYKNLNKFHALASIIMTVPEHRLWYPRIESTHPRSALPQCTQDLPSPISRHGPVAVTSQSKLKLAFWSKFRLPGEQNSRGTDVTWGRGGRVIRRVRFAPRPRLEYKVEGVAGWRGLQVGGGCRGEGSDECESRRRPAVGQAFLAHPVVVFQCFLPAHI